MIRPLTGFCMLLAAGSGLYLYQTKHQSQLLEQNITRVLKQADAARERAGVLHAEYALLNDPSRLSELANQHLTLSALDSKQFVSWTDLGRVLTEKAPVLAHLPDPAEAAEPAEPMAAATPAPSPSVPAPALVASRPEAARPEITRPLTVPALPARTVLASSNSASGPAGSSSSAIMQTPLPPPTRQAARPSVAASTAPPPATRYSAPAAPQSAAPQSAAIRQAPYQPPSAPALASAPAVGSAPAVASALGMARAMMRAPIPFSPANAATPYANGGGG